MTTKHHPGGDDAATLYRMADAMHARALAQTRDAIGYASVGEWDAAEAAMQAARRSEGTAAELTKEADDALR